MFGEDPRKCGEDAKRLLKEVKSHSDVTDVSLPAYVLPDSKPVSIWEIVSNRR